MQIKKVIWILTNKYQKLIQLNAAVFVHEFARRVKSRTAQT